jgi:hypothetical protein
MVVPEFIRALPVRLHKSGALVVARQVWLFVASRV